MGRFGLIHFTARSPDLTPIIDFLGDALKQKVYTNEPQFIRKVYGKFIKGIEVCLQIRGGLVSIINANFFNFLKF